MLSNGFVVERWLSSDVRHSEARAAYHHHRQCAFRGRVIGFTHSRVAVNVCNGLSGLITVKDANYFIEPVNASKSEHISGDGLPHILYKPIHRASRDPRSPRRPDDTYCSANNPSDVANRYAPRESSSRTRRSESRERTVESLVVVDHTMMEYYRDQLIETYVLTIMNMVSDFYHDSSIGNSVNVVLVRLILLEEEQDDLDISHHADNTLNSFCKWQEKINPEGDDDPMHFDNAILLTRKDLCQGINEPCSTLGLAHVSGMCHRRQSCSVNEDNGLSLGFTVAHEMGHNLGMQHDGSGNQCASQDDINPHVMSSRVLGGVSPFTWSTCSRDYITQFLDRGWGNCLEDAPASLTYTYLYPSVLPGVMYSADHQCRLQYGPNATVCPTFESDLCNTLWCSVRAMCQSRMAPAAPGTRCGKDKWCIAGACVEIEERPSVINGGWGSWSEWSECSLSCGTGVMSRERQCNNPRPSYGGKYCVGERKKYALCNLQECPVGSASIRLSQCSAYNGLQPDGTIYDWMSTYVEGKPCELYCRLRDALIPERLSTRVQDGTPCARLSTDICIDGFCQKVGCDNQVNSAAVEDRCGVCHGDGSTCQTIKDKFTTESGQGYVEATVIPAGARNIVVEEIAAAGNYIAIRDTAGRYLLNGDWFIQWSGEYEAAGTTISYERVGDKERVEAQGPLTEPLHIMLLFRVQNPGIVYEYTLPRPTNETDSPPQHFSWTFGDWSSCSASCGRGYQRSSVMCIERIAGIVDNTYCEEEKPDDIQQTCNEHQCPAVWWVGPWQHCSVSCGSGGQKRRSVFCIRGMMNGEQGVLEDPDCYEQGQEKPITETTCEDALPCEQTVDNWLAGEWSPCSVTCGEGWHTRSVVCVNANGSCDMAGKPPVRQPCLQQKCDDSDGLNGPLSPISKPAVIAESEFSSSHSGDHVMSSLSSDYVYSFGEWEQKVAAKKQDAGTPNDRSFGSLDTENGRLDITITTHDIASNVGGVGDSRNFAPPIDPDSFFAKDILFQADLTYRSETSSSIDEEQFQSNELMSSVEWSAREWQSCSVTCGQGIQHRVVECIDATSGHVTEGCPERTPPPATQTCHIETCPRACSDTLSATMCLHVAQSGNCDVDHFGDRCCVTCERLR